MLLKNDFFLTAPRTRRLEKNCLFCYTSRKYTVRWNKKAYSKFPTYFANFFVPTYGVSVAKCNKINNIFPNGMCATPFEKNRFFVTSCDKYTVSVFCSNLKCILSHIYIENFRYISEILNLFCKRFLFQVRVHFVV